MATSYPSFVTAALLALLVGCGNGEIGNGHSSAPNGYLLPEGSAVSRNVDPKSGTTTETFPDGTVVVTLADGSQTISYPNGASVRLDPDGNVIESVTPHTPAANPNATITPEEAIKTVSIATGDVPPRLPVDFNREASLAAFEQSLYPLLRSNCANCHSRDSIGQRPLPADSDVGLAHDETLGYVNLRQVPASRLISRMLIDGHNCWSDCASDAQQVESEVKRWSDLLGEENLPPLDVLEYPDELTEAVVLEWIISDRMTQASADAPYLRYASLHVLYNAGTSPDDMNIARAGLSKALNSTARYAPEIVNPVAIDEYSLVYRFDVRDYWGYARESAFSFGDAQDTSCLEGATPSFGATGDVEPRPDCGLESWDRIAQGNTHVSKDDSTWSDLGSPANNAGFATDYVEASQLVYTLSRPDVYNELLRIPFSGAALEAEVGIDTSQTYQFMTVNDAVSISERLMWRAPIPDGYYWRSVDQFSTVDFIFYTRPVPTFTRDDNSQIITTPLLTAEGGVSTPNGYTGDTGAQAQGSEVIFSLPNGLQGYAIFGAGNQRRSDTFTFVAVDPRRMGEWPGLPPADDQRFNFNGVRLLNGASCMGCHAGGINRAPDDMRPFIAANPAGEWTAYATRAEVEALYPGTQVMTPIIEADRAFFLAAQSKIAEGMLVGTTDTRLYTEPIQFMFEFAQRSYGYINTISN